MRGLGAMFDRAGPCSIRHSIKRRRTCVGGREASPVLRFIVVEVGERRRWHRPHTGTATRR
jgi:hypothetical protein